MLGKATIDFVHLYHIPIDRWFYAHTQKKNQFQCNLINSLHLSISHSNGIENINNR